MSEQAQQAAPTAQERWLEERQSGIGASEIAAVLGVNPYMSPYTVWAQKVGLVESDADEKEAVYWGHALQPAVAARWSQVAGIPIVDLGQHKIQRSPDYPHLFATLDYEIPDPRFWPMRGGDAALWPAALSNVDGPGVLEIKTAGIRSSSEWYEGGAPLHYQVQVQGQLAVTGYRWGVLACLVGGQQLKWAKVERNDAFIAEMTARVEDFWDLVAGKTPPNVDGSESTTRTLKALHPSDSGATIKLDADAEWLWNLREAHRGSVKAAEDKQRGVENQLRELLGTATWGEFSNGARVQLKTEPRVEKCKGCGGVVRESAPRIFRLIKARGAK